MKPTTPLLVVVAGPARGRSVPIVESVSIGRDEANALPIPDLALSRRHCVVETQGGGVSVRDLASKNGVFVNGCPVTQRQLADGDQIRIGDSALVIVIPAAEGAVSLDSDVTLDQAPMPTTATVDLETARTHYIERQPSKGTRPGARDADELSALLALSEALQPAATLDAVGELLVAHALRASGAGASALLAEHAGDEGLTPVVSRSTSGAPVTINASVAAEALGQGAAVLAADAGTVCVPIISSDQHRWVLCLAADQAPRRLSHRDLHVLAAIGAIGRLAVDRVRHLAWLQDENRRLTENDAVTHNFVGESAAMQSVYRFIGRVAPTDTTVLLRGESGTGKELVAAAIHANSSRARGPFVAINCAALPEALLESELFGHERGAFTGALAQQKGRLEMADHGTVFLDEIGELAPSLQAKLLRVLEDRVVERVGGRRGIKIDVRVIAATNLDLERAMANGVFRRDLFFRLDVVSLTMPPLRERRDDIPLLAAYFVRRHAERCKRIVKGISPAARTLLTGYDWPGNVRELSNVLERAVVLGATDVVVPEDLPEALLDAGAAVDDATDFHAKVAAHKRAIIEEALSASGGNVAQAARDLGLQPTYLHRLIRNLGLRASPADDPARP